MDEFNSMSGGNIWEFPMAQGNRRSFRFRPLGNLYQAIWPQPFGKGVLHVPRAEFHRERPEIQARR